MYTQTGFLCYAVSLPEEPHVEDLKANSAYGVLDSRLQRKTHQKGNKNLIPTAQVTSTTTPQEILQPSDLFSTESLTVVKKPAPYEQFVPAAMQSGPDAKTSTTTSSEVVRNPMYAEPTTQEEVKCHAYEEINPKHLNHVTAAQGPVIYDEVKHDPDGVNLRGNPCYGVTSSTTHR